MTVGETPIPDWPRNDSDDIVLIRGRKIAEEVVECKNCNSEELCQYHDGKTEGYDKGLTEGHRVSDSKTEDGDTGGD